MSAFLKSPLLLAAAVTVCLIAIPETALAQSQNQSPTKFSRQFKIDRKSGDLLSNNADTPREARNDRRKRRAQARRNDRKNEIVRDERTASQEKLGEEKRIGRRERQSRDARSRQRARNAAAPADNSSGGMND